MEYYSEKLHSPLEYLPQNQILNQYKQYFKMGSLHILLYNYSFKYCKNLQENYFIPYKQKKEIVPLIIINNPKDVENIAENNVTKMPNFKPFLFNSIISTDDDDNWLRQRRHFTQAFSMNDQLKPLVKKSNQIAELSVLRLAELEKINSDININEFFLSETIKQLMLGLIGMDETMEKTYNKIVRLGFSKPDYKLSKNNVENIRKEIDDLNGSLGEKLNNNFRENEQIGNFLIFLFAGHDTTGHTLTWLIYELSKNSNYQERLINEIDLFWNDLGEKEIKYEDFKKLPFLTKCIMETLRLWTPIPNGTFRKISGDCEIVGKKDKNVLIKEGTYVQIPNWIRHRNKELWGGDVNIFNPDRDFCDDEIWNNTVINAYNPNSARFSPFTYGPRDCIGKNFAQIEMRLILLHLFKHYRFRLTQAQESIEGPENLTFNTFTMGPRDINNKTKYENKLGLYVNLIERNIDSKL